VTTLTRHAPAKINLHLHITGRKDDGYHLLDSLVAFTNLYDTIEIRDASQFELTINNAPDCPIADNLVTRAVHLLCNHFKIPPHIHIDLTKAIPMGAGLGGGSADAAATLLALRDFWKLDAPPPLLQKFASELGSDIVACLQDKPMIMRDTGNTLLPAPTFPTLYGVLVIPPTHCPTPLVYKIYKDLNHKFSQNIIFPDAFDSTQSFCDFLNTKTQNYLTAAAIAVNPDVKTVLHELENLENGLLTRLSGSGSSCFTLFKNETTATKQCQIIQDKHPEWSVKYIRIND
jgi:4-diphosphocytidyl-2-C-methyl-D-erythritol kinase